MPWLFLIVSYDVYQCRTQLLGGLCFYLVSVWYHCVCCLPAATSCALHFYWRIHLTALVFYLKPCTEALVCCIACSLNLVFCFHRTGTRFSIQSGNLLLSILLKLLLQTYMESIAPFKLMPFC